MIRQNTKFIVADHHVKMNDEENEEWKRNGKHKRMEGMKDKWIDGKGLESERLKLIEKGIIKI